MTSKANAAEAVRPKHVVITGASSGIGAALARVYARQGCKLYLLGRNAERLEGVARDCRALGIEPVLGLADVTDSDAMRRLLVERDSDRAIDIVIANAGIGGHSAIASEAGEDQSAAIAILTTNVIGVANTVVPLLPRFVARRRGHVVIIGSLAGLIAVPHAPAYAASKAAVRAYGHALRRLLSGSGVKVTIVSPGFVETPMSAGLSARAFVWSAERAATHIARGIASGKREIAFPLPLTFAIRLGSLLPTAVTDFILSRAFRRARV
jgi:short-subunit dehydrogenase